MVSKILILYLKEKLYVKISFKYLIKENRTSYGISRFAIQWHGIKFEAITTVRMELN